MGGTQPTKANRTIEVDEEITDDYIRELARRTEGFSGRQIAKLVLAFQVNLN